eukprot:jgi/Chrzof1/1759/Cz10g20040.t1
MDLFHALMLKVVEYLPLTAIQHVRYSCKRCKDAVDSAVTSLHPFKLEQLLPERFPSLTSLSYEGQAKALETIIHKPAPSIVTQGTDRGAERGVLVSSQTQDVWHTRIRLAAAQESGNATASGVAADIGQLTLGNDGSSSSSSSHYSAIGRLNDYACTGTVPHMRIPGSAPAVIVSCGGWFTELRLLPDLGHVKQALQQPWDSFMTGLFRQVRTGRLDNPADMAVGQHANQQSGPAPTMSLPTSEIPLAAVTSLRAGSKQLWHVQVARQVNCSTDGLDAALAQLAQLPQLPALSIDMNFLRVVSSQLPSLPCLTQLRMLSLLNCMVLPMEALQALSQLRALKLAGIGQPLRAYQLQMLGSRLPGLQYLMIMDCVIAQAKTPEEATLQYDTLEDEAFWMIEPHETCFLPPPHPQSFGAFTFLRLLSLSGSKQRLSTPRQPLWPCLMQLPYLRFLDLAGFNTGRDELGDVAMLTQLHYLNLDEDQLGAGASHKLHSAQFVVMSGAKDMFDEVIEAEVINQVQ